MNAHRRLTHLVLTALLCLVLTGAREVPSTAELRQMVADKQFKRALREVARAMQLRGDDAAAYDRGELLLIRADAQLGMRIEPGAAKSYRDAAAETATTADHRATGRAMSMLMSKCERLVYTPRTGDAAGRGIDIVADRKAALEALLADELAALKPKVRAAKEKKRIADVLEAVNAIEPVAALERAVSSSTARTDEYRKGFVAHMETLLDEALLALDARADAIESAARGAVVVPQQVQPGQTPPATIKVKKRGLSPADEAALKQVMETCREVVARHREVAEQLGAEPERFRRAGDFAIRLSSKAGAILRADYSGVADVPADQAPKPIGGTRTETSSPPPGTEPAQP